MGYTKHITLPSSHQWKSEVAGILLFLVDLLSLFSDITFRMFPIPFQAFFLTPSPAIILPRSFIVTDTEELEISPDATPTLPRRPVGS